MHPGIAELEAFFTPGSSRRDVREMAGVRTFRHRDEFLLNHCRNACCETGETRRLPRESSQQRAGNREAYEWICRLLVTRNVPGTEFARTPATCLSISLATAPSKVMLPFSTMMWMEGIACSA